MEYKYPYIDMSALTASYQPELSHAIERTIASGHYLNGEALNHFEQAFAQYCGTDYCIGVANGLDALTLALIALKLTHNWPDTAEVIVPTLTFVATAEAVYRAGLTPVLADVDPHTFVLTAETIAPQITPHTRVIIPVHLYGLLAPMTEIRTLAKSYNIILLEDAAQAHGASLKGERAGCSGDIAAFSFYPGKNLGALGDGGAIVTNHAEWAALCRTLANYGSKQKYHHTYHGINSRLDDIQAAVLAVKLQRLDSDNNHRRKIATLYTQHISNRSIHLPYQGVVREDSVYHIFPILTERRNDLIAYLASESVQALIHYPFALHQLPPYTTLTGYLPHSEAIVACEVSLPISPIQTLEDTYKIIDIINKFR